MHSKKVWLAPLCAVASVATAQEDAVIQLAARRSLSEVVVIGNRPTSLPTEIPTTIEGVTAEDIAVSVNATDAEDALKYFPSLLVRKRYIGDYDHAVLATRASGTGNSARSLVYADGILLSNLLGNGASFTPRWGLVTPEEIERVDVLYGPFSAAYPGNSVGAVVDYVTRMPTKLEAHARVGGFTQKYRDDDYGVNDRYSGYQASASVGDKSRDFSWWLNFNHLDSEAQPVTFANKLVPVATSTSGTPVTGARPGFNPRNQPWIIIGTGTQTNTIQDHGKVKLAYDFSDALRASYTFGVWRNEAERNAETLLRDAATGSPVYSGSINFQGRHYTIASIDIAGNRGELRHVIHGLSVKTDRDSEWNWEVAGSLYDYDKNIVRAPTIALPTARSGGAGLLTDMRGTGWNTLAAKGVWRPDKDNGAHTFDFGVQQDTYRLRTRVFNTSDWISGAPFQPPASEFRGNTQLRSAYAQDAWQLNDAWRAYIGLRYEDWHADNDGLVVFRFGNFTHLPDRDESYFSPKLAISHDANEQWSFKASLGRAVRMPTVSELYQGTTVPNSETIFEPLLRPERSYTSEMSAQGHFVASELRTTVFFESTRDAIYSQAFLAPNGNAVNTVQNVNRIRTTGVEVVYKISGVAVAGLDMSTSVTYARSRIIENRNFPASEGKWQPRVPDWRANFLATYRVGENLSLTLGARYSGRQYNTLDNVDSNGAAYTGVSKFFVMDVRARHRFADRWHASLGIDNLNNETYWNFHNYPQRTYLAEIGWDL